MAVGTNLTTDGNFSAVQGQLMLPYPATVGVQFLRGGLIAVDGTTGLAIRVPANDGATDNTALKIVGQCIACPAGLSVSGDIVTVRTNCAVELDNPVPLGQSAVQDLVFANDDHSATSGAALNPKLGVFIGLNSVSGLPLVQLTPFVPA